MRRQILSGLDGTSMDRNQTALPIACYEDATLPRYQGQGSNLGPPERFASEGLPMNRLATSTVAVEFSGSDSRPMAESRLHRECMTYVCGILNGRFEKWMQREVYESGNLFVYYKQGNRESLVTPHFALEAISLHTASEDGGRRRAGYISPEVEKCFLHSSILPREYSFGSYYE